MVVVPTEEVRQVACHVLLSKQTYLVGHYFDIIREHSHYYTPRVVLLCPLVLFFLVGHDV